MVLSEFVSYERYEGDRYDDKGEPDERVDDGRLCLGGRVRVALAGGVLDAADHDEHHRYQAGDMDQDIDDRKDYQDKVSGDIERLDLTLVVERQIFIPMGKPEKHTAFAAGSEIR
jgi:hypothetical protein